MMSVALKQRSSWFLKKIVVFSFFPDLFGHLLPSLSPHPHRRPEASPKREREEKEARPEARKKEEVDGV